MAAHDAPLLTELDTLQAFTDPRKFSRIRSGNTAGTPSATGVIRSKPADFQVTEIPSVTPSGNGEHLFLKIRKTSQNTAWVAKRLVEFAGVKPNAVNYAGLKDRHAVTEQWFSIWMPGQTGPDWNTFRPEGVEICEVTRHRTKLRRGDLRGNRFAIVLRQLMGDRAQLVGRLEQVGEQGVPNYFGAQRFGRGRSNLKLLPELFNGSRWPREKTSLALSAARSVLFNRYLNQRVTDNTWNKLSSADIPLSDRDGDLQAFSALAGEQALERPTGILWGEGRGRVSDAETAFFDQYPALCQLLIQQGLRRHRRSLWLPVVDLEYDFKDSPDNGVLRLNFTLPPGSFATSVLAALLDFRHAMFRDS